MVNLYCDLIRNGVINNNTGEPWKIDDVPSKWRAQVAEALAG